MRMSALLMTFGVVATAILSTLSASAQQSDFDAYVQCTFRPQAAECDKILAAKEASSPAAESVKAAYESYGRYLLAPPASLTDEDRRYLTDNAIRLPEGLTSSDLSGLHHVINDPAFAHDEAARRIGVNGFISRAVQAELYCGFNKCGV